LDTSDKKNAVRIVEVLNQFGFGSYNLGIEDFTTKDQIIQLGYPPNRIDLITSVAGLDFSECYPRRTSFEADGMTIQTISLEDLKKNKKASGRHKDLDDLENLK